MVNSDHTTTGMVTIGELGEVETLLKVLRRRRDQYLDLKIVCSDGSLLCHRLVIGAHSKYLRGILMEAEAAAGASEEMTVLCIPGVGLEIMKRVIKFLYSGKLIITMAQVSKVKGLLERVLKIDARMDLPQTPESEEEENEVEAMDTAVSPPRNGNNDDDDDAGAGGSGGSAGAPIGGGGGDTSGSWNGSQSGRIKDGGGGDTSGSWNGSQSGRAKDGGEGDTSGSWNGSQSGRPMDLSMPNHCTGTSQLMDDVAPPSPPDSSVGADDEESMRHSIDIADDLDEDADVKQKSESCQKEREEVSVTVSAVVEACARRETKHETVILYNNEAKNTEDLDEDDEVKKKMKSCKDETEEEVFVTAVVEARVQGKTTPEMVVLDDDDSEKEEEEVTVAVVVESTEDVPQKEEANVKAEEASSIKVTETRWKGEEVTVSVVVDEDEAEKTDKIPASDQSPTEASSSSATTTILRASCDSNTTVYLDDNDDARQMGSTEREEMTEEVLDDDDEAVVAEQEEREPQFHQAPSVISKRTSSSNPQFFAKKSTSGTSTATLRPRKVIAKRTGAAADEQRNQIKRRTVMESLGVEDEELLESLLEDVPSPVPSSAYSSRSATPDNHVDPDFIVQDAGPGPSEANQFFLDLPNPMPQPPEPGLVCHRGEWVTPERRHRLMATREVLNKKKGLKRYNYQPFLNTITGHSKLETVAAAENEEDGEFPCPHCGDKFARERSLNCHVSRKHNSKANVPCPEGCGKMLSGKAAIKKHLLSHRPSAEWPYECRIPGCGKTFQAKGDLPKHWLTRKHALDAPKQGTPEFRLLIQDSVRVPMMSDRNCRNKIPANRVAVAELESAADLQQVVLDQPAFPQNDSAFPQNDTAFPQNDTAFPQNDTAFPQNDTAFPQNDTAFPQNDTAFLQNEAVVVANVNAQADQQPPTTYTGADFVEQNQVAFQQNSFAPHAQMPLILIPQFHLVDHSQVPQFELAGTGGGGMMPG